MPRAVTRKPPSAIVRSGWFAHVAEGSEFRRPACRASLTGAAVGLEVEAWRYAWRGLAVICCWRLMVVGSVPLELARLCCDRRRLVHRRLRWRIGGGGNCQRQCHCQGSEFPRSAEHTSEL